ncbi:MAG: GNAT family N-acetyltransferase [Clostridia bacterium]|nr:GNAT family N-acetyltransferase [Clostridia bacterium]
MTNPFVYYRITPNMEPKRDPRIPVRELDWHGDLALIRRFYARFTDTPFDPDVLPPNTGKPLAILAEEEIASFAIPFSFREGETEIGGTATVPEYRNKGYCRALIAEMASRILAQGLTAVLTTHRDNLPMRAAAEGIGMEAFTRGAE